ncbi:hypothetical protein [Saccharopolyspora phatthalungensis]|uniref:Gram-positive cocci surface proteins LPxTG domain-containing protein n=1 Tax=Saccharopolyspora phatthalungensis TaxID=664693 RepID=A0A840Q3I3_9PSEU|nr:hypothetical protein [Saccharopolyspora phatthalungensis]MBB5155074.1 hypothetical protein [Saccharopolyspora phatthalungensis]
MWRTGRVLAGLAIGLFLLFTPPALADEAAPPVASVTVQAQDPGQPPAHRPVDERQRLAIGTTGVVLIGLVLLSRKLRKKPVFFVKWKK